MKTKPIVAKPKAKTEDYFKTIIIGIEGTWILCTDCKTICMRYKYHLSEYVLTYKHIIQPKKHKLIPKYMI